MESIQEKGTKIAFTLPREMFDAVSIMASEARAAFRAAGSAALDRRCAPAESRSASAFARKSRQEMLILSLFVDDPGCVKTLCFIMSMVIPAI